MTLTPHRASTRPHGVITRGTTGDGRLRRVDAWMVHRLAPTLAHGRRPVVVDLGFGASPSTTFELHRRLAAIRSDIEMVGIEIDRDRVARALDEAATRGIDGVTFLHGGFELAGLAARGRNVQLVRAFNVLREYDERDVSSAWVTMQRGLSRGGAIVEGTCDEEGRLLSWVTLDDHRPRTLTLAADVGAIERPSDLAERLPKVLIHRNVAGEAINRLFTDWDRAWRHAAPLSVFGARGRWVRSIQSLRAQCWPVLDGPASWRRGSVTLRWDAVAPRGWAVDLQSSTGAAG